MLVDGVSVDDNRGGDEEGIAVEVSVMDTVIVCSMVDDNNDEVLDLVRESNGVET